MFYVHIMAIFGANIFIRGSTNILIISTYSHSNVKFASMHAIMRVLQHIFLQKYVLYSYTNAGPSLLRVGQPVYQQHACVFVPPR